MEALPGRRLTDRRGHGGDHLPGCGRIRLLGKNLLSSIRKTSPFQRAGIPCRSWAAGPGEGFFARQAIPARCPGARHPGEIIPPFNRCSSCIPSAIRVGQIRARSPAKSAQGQARRIPCAQRAGCDFSFPVREFDRAIIPRIRIPSGRKKSTPYFRFPPSPNGPRGSKRENPGPAENGDPGRNQSSHTSRG